MKKSLILHLNFEFKLKNANLSEKIENKGTKSL